MEELVAYRSSTEAELVRARLEDEGIPARVADWSAMNELSDYRVFVPTGYIVEAAAILGVPEPNQPPPLPGWVLGVIAVVAVVLAALLIWGLLGI